MSMSAELIHTIYINKKYFINTSRLLLKELNILLILGSEINTVADLQH